MAGACGVTATGISGLDIGRAKIEGVFLGIEVSGQPCLCVAFFHAFALLYAVPAMLHEPLEGSVYGFSLARNALRNLAILGEMTNWQ